MQNELREVGLQPLRVLIQNDAYSYRMSDTIIDLYCNFRMIVLL